MNFKKLLNSILFNKEKAEDPDRDILNALFANHSEWDKFPLGKTPEGEEVFWNPALSPHVLLAGREGKGEFIRNIAVHTRQHADKWNLSFITVFRQETSVNLNDALASLKKIEEDISDRFAEMKKHGVKDYRAVPEMTGEIVIVEECRWLFLNDNKVVRDTGDEKKHVQIQEALKRIVMLGFECGVHLVLGTEKTPDSIFDGSFKELFPVHIVTEKLLEEGADKKFLEMRDNIPLGKLSYFSENGAVTTYRPYVSSLKYKD